ncbi:hypothetical protein J7T55_014385 [Diaporthe amygdali]|uniref:uncharacterized protein n=1 Tax=Phomopsis amygdali TaxID=1214568 RepID=UPI0022FE4232|nr:uncharacterized protein J7T55_014385 [Diaporthe amygdali]KAJ0117935.1 hypothetical protein J7T55_014385 [Diaporthe amygdali]
MSGDEREDDYDDVPLHHRKPFGSGLRRNEIKFVPALNEDPNTAKQPGGQTNGKSISDFYLNMVLKKPEPATMQKQPATVAICDICKIPLTPTDKAASDGSSSGMTGGHHESSIAHQVCLAHSHPPSALDRTRMGLSVLESQGWDPDARTGLGAAGQGTHYPIKAKSKDDRLGIGVVVPKDFEAKKEKEKPKLLDAKKVRKMAAEDRKRADRLQQRIFGRVDLEKYLGPDA